MRRVFAYLATPDERHAHGAGDHSPVVVRPRRSTTSFKLATRNTGNGSKRLDFRTFERNTSVPNGIEGRRSMPFAISGVKRKPGTSPARAVSDNIKTATAPARGLPLFGRVIIGSFLGFLFIPIALFAYARIAISEPILSQRTIGNGSIRIKLRLSSSHVPPSLCWDGLRGDSSTTFCCRQNS